MSLDRKNLGPEEKSKLTELVEKYLFQKSKYWSETTIASTAGKLRTAIKYEFHPETIYEQLKKEKYSLYYIKNILILCRQFEQEMLASTVFEEFMKEISSVGEFRHAYKERTFSLSLNKVMSAIAAAKATEDFQIYNFLILTAGSGLRRSEAMAVKWSDLENGWLRVVGKGSKQRVVPCSGIFGDFSLAILDSPFIVGSIEFRRLQRFLKQFLPKACSKDLRAFFITQLARAKMSPFDLARFVGHADVNTTMKYVRRATQGLPSTIQNLILMAEGSDDSEGVCRINGHLDQTDSGERDRT